MKGGGLRSHTERGAGKYVMVRSSDKICQVPYSSVWQKKVFDSSRNGTCAIQYRGRNLLVVYVYATQGGTPKIEKLRHTRRHVGIENKLAAREFCQKLTTTVPDCTTCLPQFWFTWF